MFYDDTDTMFRYHTVYRTEGVEPPSLQLTAAAPYPDAAPGEDAWIFWSGWDDATTKMVRVFRFAARREGIDGVIVASLIAEDGTAPQEVRFIPVLIEDIQARPEYYDLPEAPLSSSQGDVHLVYHAAEVSEAYEGWVAPPEVHVTPEDVTRLEIEPDELLAEMEAEGYAGTWQILDEEQGVRARIGDVHWWKDGPHQRIDHRDPKKRWPKVIAFIRPDGHAYVKRDDGSFRRVRSAWTDRDSEGVIPESTKEAYLRPNERGMPEWPPERKRKHHAIIEKMFAGKKPVQPGETPTVVILMGLPASGKSCLIEHAIPELQPLREFANIDPDEVLAQLPEFELAKQRRVRNGASALREEAGMVNDIAFMKAAHERYNFVIQGTGESYEWFERKVLALADEGYRVCVYMPHINDEEELVLRAEERGERTGRFVPARRIKELYKKLPKNFLMFARDPRVLEAVLVNTSHTRPNATAAYALRRETVGAVPVENALDPVFYAEFQKHIYEAREKGLNLLAADWSGESLNRMTAVLTSIREDLKAIENAPKQFAPGSGLLDELPSYVGIPYEGDYD